MSEARYERIELTRVGRGTDLWPAIEAAQYGHVLDHEEPRTEPEREAVAAFAASFARWVEEWEERPREVRSTILQDLGRHLDTLTEHGLFLYAATIEREVETETGACVRMPVALLAISKDAAPTQELWLAAGTQTE